MFARLTAGIVVVMLENFGGNIRFQPTTVLSPHTEEELLAMMNSHRGQRLRPIGRLHSWCEIIRGNELVLDLRHLDSVTVRGDVADVGAGCQIHRIVLELLRQGNLAPPSLGMIMTQTIAGATATGTHGSGRHSLSHYIQAVRLATYDPETGRATIRTLDSGAALEAARCSIGCLGIVTQVTLPTRFAYRIEEHFRRYDGLQGVLAAEADFPLQQFYWVPWRWDYFAQHRRESGAPRSWSAPLYRLYWSVGMDVGLHVIVRCLARYLPPACTRLFYRQIMPLAIPRGWKVVDRFDRQLTMKRELFRHMEIEIFVRRSELSRATELSRRLLEESSRDGIYHHHYPVCIRKILADKTLISPASGVEDQYSLSFISYALPKRRDGFFRFAESLARTLATECGGRPHWGKVCPLSPAELQSLYPQLTEFVAIARELDSERRFGNTWTDRLFTEVTRALLEPSDKT